MKEPWRSSATGCLVLMGFVAAVAYTEADGLQRQPAAMPAPAAAQQSQPAEAPAVSPQHALLNRYCISCHNAKLKTGGLALDTVDVDRVG